MYCSRCGNKLIDGAAFCSVCGNKIEIPAQQPQSYPVQKQSDNQVNKPMQPQQGQQQAPQSNQPLYQQQGLQGNQSMQQGSQGNWSAQQQMQSQQVYKQSSAKSQKRGLSTGAIIGIIAGVSVLFLASITAILVVFFFIRGKNNGLSEATTQELAYSEEITTEEITTEEVTTEATTEASTEAATEKQTAEAVTEATDNVTYEMSEKYLSVLQEHKKSIKKYTWQRGYNSDKAYPVAFKDLTGDGIDEMIFMEADNEYAASLYIYTFADGEARQIYSMENLDVEVAGGTTFYVAALKDNAGLFIYHSVTDEGSDELFDKLELSDGVYKVASTYERSAYPNEDYTSMNVTCKADGKKVEESEFANYINDNQNNIETFLMHSEGEDLDTLVSKSGEINMTYKEATSKLKEDIGSNEPESEEAVSLPVDESIQFLFASGAGGWGTFVSIDKDGNFSGGYSDSDMGDTGDDYPNGTIYVSTFTGKFKNIKQIDEYTYEMELESYKTDKSPETVEINDGIRYVYSEPYGISGGETFYMYLPGKPISELSEEFLSWSYGIIGKIENDKELKTYGLYNEEMGEGFFVYSE
ncbi:zinc-ribbon domain-containing protein [Lachnospiraceae bacterium]|nr:zinc-ribbon domain-containing protein [Lachnospiraceae bacterium]